MSRLNRRKHIPSQYEQEANAVEKKFSSFMDAVVKTTQPDYFKPEVFNKLSQEHSKELEKLKKDFEKIGEIKKAKEQISIYKQINEVNKFLDELIV